MEVQGHAAMSFATILHSDAIQPHTFTSTLLPTLLAQLKSKTPGAYVRTCIHVCGAVCYVHWVNGSGPTLATVSGTQKEKENTYKEHMKHRKSNKK